MGLGIPCGFHISWCFSTQPRCTGPHFGCTITDIQTTKERDCGHQVTMSAASTRDPWQRLRRMLRKKPLLVLWNIQINQVECVTKAHLSSKKRSFFSGFRFFGTTWFYGCFFVFINPLTIGWFPYFFLHVPHPITDRLQAVSSSILRTSTSCPQGPDEVKATAPQGVWAGCNWFFSTEFFPPEKHDFHQHCETSEVDIEVPLKDLLLNLPEGDRWEDAKLMPCLDYVLKSKLLKVPDDYKDVLFDLFSFKKPWSRMINSDQLWSSIPIHFNSIKLNSGNLLIQRRPAVAKSSLGVHEAFRIHSKLSFVQKITKLHKIMLKSAGVIWRNSGVIARNGILKNLYRSKPMDLEDLASASCHEFGNFSPGS